MDLRRHALLIALLCGCGESSYDLDGGDAITVGALFVQQRNCAKCHRAPDGTLSGRTTPVEGLVYPANLTPDVQTGLGGWADIEIVRAMRFGVDNQGELLCPQMPHFDGTSQVADYHDYMTDVEANAIVAYLRSLAPVSKNIPASMCPPIKPPALPDLSSGGG
jgi:hypothetical protein